MKQQLVVVGNGMAGVACVEQILKHAPRLRDHDLRRRDARQLQPHPAVVGARRREGRRRDRAQRARVVPAATTSACALGVARRRRRLRSARPSPATTAASTPYDKLLLATGSTRVHAADRRARQGRRLRVPHARRHARAARARRGPACKAVVIGGGLLGLEAARGLQVQGCDVTVVHLMATLMERQLDPDGGDYLAGKMEDLGVRVLLRTSDDGDSSATSSVEGVAFADGDDARSRSGRGRRRHPAERRARPQGRPARSTAASSSTTTWRRRIPTSSRSASASSIAASATGWWRRSSSRARCWRRRSPATAGPTYTGTVQAAKLKIMGVDVFSAGDWSEQNAGAGAVRRSRARRLQEARRARRQARRRDPGRRHLGQPPLHGLAADRRGPDRAAPPSAVPAAGARTPASTSRRCRTARPICGCIGVTKGTIIQAIHEQGVNTLSQLKETHARLHRAAAAARRCARTCCGPSRRSSRRKARRCCAAACRSPRTTCARSCAASG